MVFGYTAVVAALPRRRQPEYRGRIFGGTVLALFLTAVIAGLDYRPVLHDWVAPPVLLLLAYWTTGLLFVTACPRQERILFGLDRRLAILERARRTPRWLAELLELAYSSVYLLIPAALVLHLLFSPAPEPARFWSVILIADYICFAVLPWVQTRPPRALEQDEPWRSAVRALNLRLLGAASIRVNTFPSGHAAEGLAAALLAIDAPLPVAAGMLGLGLAVAAGAVLGRYHYAADALAGWVVALAVWLALGGGQISIL